MANSSRFTSRHRAGVKANKERKLKKNSEKGKEKAASENEEDVGERDESLEPEADMDLGSEDWAKSPSGEAMEPDYNESQDHTQKY